MYAVSISHRTKIRHIFLYARRYPMQSRVYIYFHLLIKNYQDQTEETSVPKSEIIKTEFLHGLKMNYGQHALLSVAFIKIIKKGKEHRMTK